MADDGGAPTAAPETAALQEALAAEHTAGWGYGAVGAALGPARRGVGGPGWGGRAGGRGGGPAGPPAENARRDGRDQVTALLEQRKADPVPAKAGYELPFPVLSAVDAAKLASSSRTARPRLG